MQTFFHSKYSQYFGAFIVFILIIGLFFWPFFIKGEIPIPGDILIGTYYPWINETWGFAVSPPVKNPPMSDVVSLMYPWRKLVFDYIRQGQLPLWDPNSFLGQSLIGNFQAAIFNPFNLLFILPISFPIAWGIQVIIQPFLAMFFSFILFKKWKLKFIAALIGSVGYGLSAPMLIWMEYNVLGFLVALFPLSLLCVELFINQTKARYLLGISLVTALGVFFGYIQMLYYVLFFSYVYGLALIFQFSKTRQSFIKWTLLFCFSVGLGLCLSAIQLLPGFETVGLSIRNLDVVAAGNAVTYLPYKQLLTGLVADFFGNPATYNYFGSGSYESFAFYTSIGLLPLVFWSFSDPKKRYLSIVLTIFTMGSLAMAVSGPISWLIQSLSFLGLKGSVSSRVLFIFSFGMSALAALGMQSVLEHKQSLFRFKTVAALAVISGVFLGVVLVWLWFFYLSNTVSYREFLISQMTLVKISLRNSVIPLAVCFSVTICLLLTRKLPWLVWGVLILIILDMFRFSDKYIPFTKEALVFPKTEVINFLQQIPEPYRLAIEKGELLTANTWSVYDLQSVTGYNILLPRSTADYVSVLNNGKPGQENARFLDIRNFNSPLLSQANAEYVVALKRRLGSPESDGTLSDVIDQNLYEPVFQEGPVVVLKNKASLKRYFIPEKIVYASSSADVYQHMGTKNYQANTVILGQSLDNSLNKPAGCQVDLSTYKKQEYQFNTNCEGDSLLVVSETYQTGWKVVVNNQKQSLFKVNNQFLGVKLPAGKSDVVLYYLPDTFVWGVYLSGLGVFLFILTWVFLPKLKMVLLSRA